MRVSQETVPVGVACPANTNTFFENNPLFKQLLHILITTKKCLTLGAANKGFTPDEENVLIDKVCALLLKGKKTPLSEKEQQALKPAIVMSYLLGAKYPKLLKNKTQTNMPQNDNGRMCLEFTVRIESLDRLLAASNDGKLNEQELTIFYKATHGENITPEEFQFCSTSEYLKEFVETPKVQSDSFSAEEYAASFLAFAEPALKYGAANCDGYAAVALRNLLKSDFVKTLKNICICSIDGQHMFIAANLSPLGKEKQFHVPFSNTDNGDCMVIDAYYDFVKPFPVAVAEWKAKGHKDGDVACLARIDDVGKFLKHSAIRKALKKLDGAEGQRKAGTSELDTLSKKFAPVATNIPTSINQKKK